MDFIQRDDLSVSHERRQNTISADGKYTIRTQIDMDYITVSVDEWSDLEDSINEISLERSNFIDLVSLFLGTGLTSLITIIFDIFKKEYSNLTQNTICFLVSISIAAIIYILKNKDTNDSKHYHENNTYLKLIKKDLARLKNKCLQNK